MRVVWTVLFVILSAVGSYAQESKLRLYVANQTANTISVVDAYSFEILDTIRTGLNPHEIAVHERTGIAFAGNRQEDTLSLIAIRTNREVTRIPSPGAPHGLVLTRRGKILFATGEDEIHVFDVAGRRRIASIPVGGSPHMLHVSPDDSRIYTGNMADGTMSVIEIENLTVIATVPVGGSPEDLAISPDGEEILVGNQADDTLTLIDAATNEILDTLRLPDESAPIRIRYTPDGKTIFIASRRDGAGVLRMDRATREITGKIPVAGVCVGMNFTPDGKLMFITDLRAGTISQVDPVTLEILKTVATGAGADAIELVN